VSSISALLRLSRVPSLVALLALGSACKRTDGAAVAPQDVATVGEGDARTLPAFDVGENAKPEGPERYYVPLGDAPVRGPSTAPITIVMFSDFECPYCQRGHDTILELEREYRGHVRLAYKAFPLDFHSNAIFAAMAARTAQAAGKFWEFHNLLFSQRGISYDALLEYAKAVGIDQAQLERDLESLEYGPEVRRDMRLAAKLAVSSTPTFFINGRQLRGAQPIEAFRTIIGEELKLAKQWRAEGVEPDQIYAHAIKSGYREVRYKDARRGLDPNAIYPVPVGQSPALGPKTAPVTIVMFEDFECPYCTRGHETVAAVRKRYGDRVRLVFKHNPLPFHSHAFVAARASMAAHAGGKFWAFHDALFAHGARFTEDDLVRLAVSVGLDRRKFMAAMKTTAFDRLISDDVRLAAGLVVNGTPAYFINGRPLQGALPELQFRLVIEEELDRAKAALAEGVNPEKLYEALTGLTER